MVLRCSRSTLLVVFPFFGWQPESAEDALALDLVEGALDEIQRAVYGWADGCYAIPPRIPRDVTDLSPLLPEGLVTVRVCQPVYRFRPEGGRVFVVAGGKVLIPPVLTFEGGIRPAMLPIPIGAVVMSAGESAEWVGEILEEEGRTVVRLCPLVAASRRDAGPAP